MFDSSSDRTESNPNIYLAQARVYIAGILMPTSSVTISSSFNSPPTASITLPAYPELFTLGDMDRVPVHIFVQETVVESKDFLLLFEGFITSKGYINSAIQRSVTIEAISYFDMLNDIQVKFLTQLQDMYMQYAPGNQDMAMYINSPSVFFPGHLFLYGLGSENTFIKTPSDYLENVYAFVQKGGSSEPVEVAFSETDKMTLTGGGAPVGTVHASVLASFYSQYAQQLKLMDRFERLAYFDDPGKEGQPAWELAGMGGEDAQQSTVFPIIYGMQTSQVMTQLTQRLNDSMQKRSLMELLDYLVNEMEYEFAFISNPAFHAAKIPLLPVSGSGKGTVQEDLDIEAASSSQAQTPEEEKPAKLVSTCLKPLLTDTMPPQCNVFHRSLVDNIYVNTVYKNVPTRVQVTDIFSPLAQLPQGASASALAQFGLIEYYPSGKYTEFDKPSNEPTYFGSIGSELLESERYTGPWVHQVGTPRWFHYVPNFTDDVMVKDGEGNDVPAAKVFKERFCRRQLLNAKYFARRLNATTMFDPYATAGFPGVVFDSADANFAFAGHVIAVEHTISPSEMSTKISMNFVRLLHEAAAVEIPHPITAIQNITHNKERLSEVYQSILGTPKSTTVQGANAVTFEELKDFLGSGSASTLPECHDPQQAYKYKRRNIVTFEEYCGFMGFGIETGPGPEGPATPVAMTGKFLEDRRPIRMFTTLLQRGVDPVVPAEEQIARVQQEDVAQDTAESTTGVIDSAEPDEQAQQLDSETPVSDRLEAQANEKKARAEEEKKAQQASLDVDVRTLLRSIAEKEFATLVYR